MKDLVVDQIIAVHASVIARDGGDNRLLSEGNLHQLVFRANLISDTIPRAAFVLYSLVAYPAFREGNKRAAQELTIRILAEDGYTMDSADETQICRLGEGILAFTTELQDIEDWLKSHTRKRD
jgi:prophage maintenance system killer protein